jgi:hypothetical protein
VTDFAVLGTERDQLRAECEDLRHERDQMCDLLRLAAALIRAAKNNVGTELERLIRQRDLERAKGATRNSDTMLQ